MKTSKPKVRLFNFGAAESTQDIIASPFGAMLPGPAYETWKAQSDFHETVAALYADIAGMAVTRAEALARLNALVLPVTFVDVEQGVAGLKAAFTTGGDVSRPLEQLKWGVGKLADSVSFATLNVPRPAHPNAPQPAPGKSLGTGAYERAQAD
jgi:hypothetical protein